MKYYYALYMSENLVPKRDEIINKLERGKWQFNKYLIVLTENKSNHLEFYNSVMLVQKALAKDELFVVGIAGGYNEALNLVRQITEDVYNETKGTDIRNHLLRKQREYEKGNV